jgi:LysM repeat protein
MILAMNTLRVAYGNPPLLDDPIVNAVAQSTAEIMAANQMSWHIGDVRGRIAAAGYGGGATVWATENFAVGTTMGIDQIMAAWADPDHMRPAVTAAYCHVGAGVATSPSGKTYYVLQAAYISGQACGSYSPAPGTTPQSSSGSGYVSQYIAPVKISTPDADGNVYHIVQTGQSFWSIAIAYQITIADLETWNNLTRDIPLKTGQKLFIPGKNTAGYATPTPKGMITRSTPDAEGRIIHEVQAYQALITIATAYNITVDRLLVLNGLQQDWPLQIGQKLLIDPGNVTPSPTLSAIQKLTPETDGNYYHIVQSGQTLSWIAGLYDVPLASLLVWNGLNNDSIIRPNQKLLLLVTPPATATFTPAPPTTTPSPQPTFTLTPSPNAPTDTANPETDAPVGNLWIALVLLVVILGLGWLAWFLLWRKR